VSSRIATPASHRIVVVSIVVAAVAITACALVAIAYMFGWIPARSAGSTPASFASPGQQVAGTAPGVALLPNESLVAPEAPLTPPAAATTPPKPPAAAATPARPAPTTPDYARPAPPRVIAPAVPPKPAAPAAAPAREGYCVNCGTIIATTGYRDQWEVRVRFHDGSVETFRYRAPPPFRMGQRVRLEGERLVGER
jgi:hypothetical protein